MTHTTIKNYRIPLDRAMHHAKAHNIEEGLYPLLVDDPAAFLYQHPHTAAVSSGKKAATSVSNNFKLVPVTNLALPVSNNSLLPSISQADMRWTPQSQQQHGSYHDPESPKARHSNHHFNQGIHGDYYSHQHHPVFRGHGVNSVHGSPHGSNGSVSGGNR